MKPLWIIYKKWIFLILVNALPFVLDVLFYTRGGLDNLFLLLPIIAGLAFLNHSNSRNVFEFILYQVFMLVCIICSGYASTYLYYHNVSDDSMTPVVGMLMAFLGASICIITTVIIAIVRAVKNKKRIKNGIGQYRG